MNPKLLALSASAIAMLVSGCSSTSPGPGPTPPPTISERGAPAAVLDAQNGFGSGTGNFAVNGNGGTVEVAGRTYEFTGGNEGRSYAGIRAFEYSSGNPNDPNGAAAYFGRYAGAVAVIDNTGNPRRAAFLIGGQETPSNVAPPQIADYEGVWSIVDTSNNNANGLFGARADFGNRTLGFDLRDGQGNTQYGSGNAAISGDSRGLGFDGQLTTNSASGMPGTHNTNGYFYGPNANEIAGVIGSDRPSGTDTAGFLIGGRR